MRDLEDESEAVASSGVRFVAHAPIAIRDLTQRHRIAVMDVVPWFVALAAAVLFPKHLSLGTQIVVMILFVLSLDLLVGHAGIITLGHAAFFGLGGYCAGILAVRGVHDPLLGLAAAIVLSGAAGLVSGAILLRTRGLALLMLTFGILLLLEEAANRMSWLTGGADGLQGMQVAPLLGAFEWDIFGKVGYFYSLAVAIAGFALVRMLVMSPFGCSLRAIRENAGRMEALGADVHRRLTIVYAISAALAGLAGALNAQTNQFVALNTLSFELSGMALIMLVLGGHGRLYGAFIGVPLYMIASDVFSKLNPAYWLFWVGAMLVALVFFARGGVLGLIEQLAVGRQTHSGKAR